VAAGAGVGKTTTAEEYKRTRPNVYLATMRPTTSGTHTMLAEIAEVMGIEERSANKLSRAIGRKVQGSNALLIIDEAQHLQSSALDELRSLHDAWKVGIALVGNQTVYTRLEGQGRQSSLAQLFSRVGMRLTQSKPRTEDVTTLVGAWGVSDPKMIKTLQAIAGKPGALRGVSKTLRLATMVANGGDGPLSDAHLRGAWKQLGDTLVD
jgi:DNA transposition AAA+ family ATPase